MNATRILIALVACAPALSFAEVTVVTTLPEYAWAARAVAGDLATVESILPPEQDAHTLAPRPSYAVKVGRADLFVATGLDLETWVPALLRKAGNASVMPGASGYVRATDGVLLLDVPASADRAHGDVHVYGNPHIHTSPLNMRQVARNIADGLVRIDPTHRETYLKNAEALVADLDARTFGRALVQALGGDLAARLAAEGKLFDLLESRTFRGAPMTALLGGWLGRLSKVRGAPITTYHKNWAYLLRLTGIRLVAVAEPRPGVPPSPGDIARMVGAVEQHGVKTMLAARHYPPDRVRVISKKAGVAPARVPFHVGSEGTRTYPDLVERWVRALEAVR